MARTRSRAGVRSAGAWITPLAVAPRQEITNCLRNRWSISTLLCSAFFTVIQIWALIVILALVRTEGVARAALACVMAAAVMAVWAAWAQPSRR